METITPRKPPFLRSPKPLNPPKPPLSPHKPEYQDFIVSVTQENHPLRRVSLKP